MDQRYNPDIHHRRSIRLKGYDYSSPGAYLVTACTQNRECLFGEIRDGAMQVNDVGRMIAVVWEELSRYDTRIAVDAFTVMPNHVHGIVILSDVGAGPRACPDSNAYPTPENEMQRPIKMEAQPLRAGQPQGVAPTMGLPGIVHRFKSLTIARYRQGVARNSWQPFAGRLWQRNYYEQILRNEADLHRAREYIAMNPIRWAEDENHPDRVGSHAPS